MDWHVLENTEKILTIVDYLISQQTEIRVRIGSRDTEFSSRFLEVLPDSMADGISPWWDDRPKIVMEKLAPEVGNDLLQQTSKAWIEFPVRDMDCRCMSRYLSISSTYPHYGLIMAPPETLELREIRREERHMLDIPEFLSAVFSLDQESEENHSYELSVLDYSKHGIGLLLTDKDFGLLDRVDLGDRVRGIQIFTDSAFTKLDGIVRHKTPIKEGRYQGGFILGLESNTTIEFSQLGLRPA